METVDIDVLPPDQVEAQTAERLSQALARQLTRGESLMIILSDDESGTQEALPATAAKLLVKILSEIAKGNAVIVVPLKPKQTIHEAAELLNVSWPHLMELLERGDMPFHGVGKQRHIWLADLLAHKRKSLEERKIILRELVMLNQEMGLYD